MKLRKFLSLGLSLILVCSLLSGCSMSADNEDDPLTVYLWKGELVNEMAPYIRKLVPDKEIEFIVGNNNVDLYCYMQEHGELPDIITTRRFSESDAKNLQSQLLDLSGYDIVSDYYQYAVQYYKSDDGDIQWLPVCGIPETMIVNKTLLDENGIAVPTSYDEFVEACSKLAGIGIKPYTSELAMDWAAHSLLQGTASECFASYEGIKWRSEAEDAKKEIEFDDALWGKIFDEVDTFIKDTHLDAKDAECDLESAREMFMNRKAAIFRGTPEVMDFLKSEMKDELVRIPYFSQSSEDNIVYTYPSLNVALNKDLKDDKEKLDAALKVLDGFISEEGQKIIAGGNGMISYSANVRTNLDEMKGIKSQVENNEFYIRYASNNSFTASLEAVQGLLSGKMDKEQAFEAFKTAMNKKASHNKAANLPTDYSLDFGENGRAAASSVLTTIRKSQKADLAFTPYTCYTSPVFKGDCSEKQLEMMIAQEDISSLCSTELTGAEIEKLVKAYLDGYSAGLNISEKYDLPIASGMELSVKKTDEGFALDEIKVDGESIDKTKKYSVVLTEELLEALNQVKPTAKINSSYDVTLQSVWTESIMSGNEPAEPESYITVK